MKPTDYILIMQDDVSEFEKQINAKLNEGFVFLGDLHKIDGVYVREMLKPVAPVQMPMSRPANLKGDKK